MNEFFTWTMLATYAGATLVTTLITQLIKGIGFIDRIPTRLTAYAVALVVLAFRALLKYIRCKDMDMRQKAAPEKRPLGEVLRARRTACNMTQEFVAGALGVSRQAVSKWEQGRAAPSTANLLALAKLYGACAEELLQEAE